MLKKIIPASLGAFALTIGLCLTVPTSANAGSVSLGFHSDRGSIYIGSGHRYKTNKPVFHYGKCKPRKAVRKARHFGVHNAHVKRVGRKFIIVNGRKRGNRVEVAFERRSRHCDVAWFERKRPHHFYGGGHHKRPPVKKYGRLHR